MGEFMNSINIDEDIVMPSPPLKVHITLTNNAMNLKISHVDLLHHHYDGDIMNTSQSLDKFQRTL